MEVRLSRLITNNLYVSAATYERSHLISWGSLTDLSNLIELFCLNQKVQVLARPESIKDRLETSALRKCLDDSGFIETVHLANAVTAEPIVELARSRLLLFLKRPGTDLKGLDDFLKLCLDPVQAHLSLIHFPDTEVDVLQGEAWLRDRVGYRGIVRSIKEEASFGRAVTFVARTFLYFGAAEQLDSVLVPDFARGSACKAVGREDKYLTDILMSQFDKSLQETGLLTPRTRMATLPPLAQLVFGRAKKKSDIPEEMAKLRDELAPLRNRLAEAETCLRNANRDEYAAVSRKWLSAIEELNKGYSVSDERHIVTSESLMPAAELATEAGLEHLFGAKPDPSKIGKAVSKIPFTKWARRILSRRPLWELHRLRSEIPGPEKMRNKVSILFGDIK